MEPQQKNGSENVRNATMGKDAANNAVAQHLLDAIERVRDDVEKVEFWAGAVAGFARPVPEYTPHEAAIWLPAEQASTLRSKLSDSRSSQPKSKEPGHRGNSANLGKRSRRKAGS